jgi:oligopeptidase B
MNPPVAKKITRSVGAHNDERSDDYYWLRQRDDPDVIAYLEAENAYAEERLAHTRKLQDSLYDELVARMQENDVSVPTRVDDYFYYTRTEKGKQYETHCRKHGSLHAKEHVVLDENELAKGHKYFAVGTFSVSPDHRLVAYSVDIDGSEAHTLYIKDIATGRIIEEGIPNTYYNVEWANDSRTLYYTTLNEAKRPHKLFRHTLGTPSSEDALLYNEQDESFFLGLSKTRTRRFIVVNLGSKTTTEVHVLDADDPAAGLRVIHPRRHEMEYHIAHHGDVFYILTNDYARNFKLMEAPVSDPSIENWVEVMPHRRTVKIDDIDVFRDHVVVYEREDGLKRIRIRDLRTLDEHLIQFPEPTYTFWAGENPEFNTRILRFNYTSLVTPRSVIDYDMDSREQTLMKRYDVPGGYDPADYVTTRIFASAYDGTKVPISLVHKKGLKRNGGNPLFMYGYGSYGASIEPSFVANRLSLLDRGFVYAIAHVRGGGEMGRHWYDQGKLLNKRNTFTDFIACAEHLIERGYTSAGKIACYGGSAGGLLVGAVVNMRPDLWGAVLSHVPFVDVLNTMLDETIPLTVLEYEEWGNPKDKKYYEYIRSYSPYDNLRAQYYPPILVTGGINDPRVQYWEPAKWTARLRALKMDDNPLLLRTKMSEGHTGASGRYDYLRDVALDYAFVLDCFGVKK